jgi:Cu/Ag efflux protein CusF
MTNRLAIYHLPKGNDVNAISKLAISLAIAAAAASASAQEHAHGGHEAQAGQQAAAPAVVEGEVKKIDKEAGKITLRHGDIPNLNMPGMTMAFRTRDAAMLEQVQVGDKVSFAADRVNGTIMIVELQKAH